MTPSTVPDRRAWQGRAITQVAAVAVVCVPLYVFALWTHLSQQTVTLKELFLYPLLLGGGNVALLLLIYRFICGEPITSLNLKAGKWPKDVLAGITLAAVFLGLFVLQQVVQSRWLPRPPGPPPQAILTLFQGIVNNPLLLAVWLGPVAWLGVATFEELSRVFMLNRLWAVWPRPFTRWLVLAISACLFGLVHIYQGPLNVAAITLQGFAYGWYYMRFGRVFPMIIGHALYDSLQVIQVAIAFRGG